MKTGDIVWLKSGSSAMTVGRGSDDSVMCSWFNDKNKLQSETFAIKMVTKKKPASVVTKESYHHALVMRSIG